eukprot:622266-Pelagomonas_calceolata.AAC.1
MAQNLSVRLFVWVQCERASSEAWFTRNAILYPCLPVGVLAPLKPTRHENAGPMHLHLCQVVPWEWSMKACNIPAEMGSSPDLQDAIPGLPDLLQCLGTSPGA